MLDETCGVKTTGVSALHKLVTFAVKDAEGLLSMFIKLFFESEALQPKLELYAISVTVNKPEAV